MTRQGFIERVAKYAERQFIRERASGNDLAPMITGTNIYEAVAIQLESILNARNEIKTTFRQVEEAACQVWKITRTEFRANLKNRVHNYLLPRHAICKFLADNRLMTLQAIGKALGGKDHSTVMNGQEKGSDAYVQNFLGFRIKYKEMENLLMGGDSYSELAESVMGGIE